MKKHVGFLSLLLALMLMVSGIAMAEEVAIRLAVLKGPTGMGAAQLMSQSDTGETANTYDFTIAGAPDLLVSQLITGELDMAALPTNTIALLNARTEGEVQILAVNTLGVLYLLERGDSVQQVSDLAGRQIVSAGQATTAEIVANHLFGEDVTVNYVSEHAEAVAQAIAGQYDLVLLPEPFVTSLLSQSDDFRIAIDLTAAWEEVTSSPLPMGGIAVRRAFAEAQPEAVAAFLDEYAQSVSYANEHPSEAAQLIEQYDIMAAAVAEQAIPRANMVCMTGEEMRAALEAFYAVLATDNADLIGGSVPDDAFYYAP